MVLPSYAADLGTLLLGTAARLVDSIAHCLPNFRPTHSDYGFAFVVNEISTLQWTIRIGVSFLYQSSYHECSNAEDAHCAEETRSGSRAAMAGAGGHLASEWTDHSRVLPPLRTNAVGISLLAARTADARRTVHLTPILATPGRGRLSCRSRIFRIELGNNDRSAALRVVALSAPPAYTSSCHTLTTIDSRLVRRLN